ncbi:MAG: thioredoxin domain-containing protein [Candidatus Saccharimonadales bacterium]
MNTRTWVIFGVVCVILFGGLIAYSRSQSNSASVDQIDANSILSASPSSGDIADHVLGNRDSKVVLIEYGDFQCPSCGGAHAGVKQIMEEYKDTVAFVYRNFPLTSMHPNAVAAATAAEAAGLQDKYWDMHNLVFETQNDWSNLSINQRTEQFVQYAEQVGVKDIEQFRRDQSDSRISKKISFDQALGKKKNVTATPSFFLNGEKLESDISNTLVQGDVSKIRTLLDTILKEKGIVAPAANTEE